MPVKRCCYCASPAAIRIIRGDDCFTSWYISYITWQIMFNVYNSGIFGIQWLKSDLPIIIATSVHVTSWGVSYELSPLQKIQTSFVKTRTRQRTCNPFVRSCIFLTIIRRSSRRTFYRKKPSLRVSKFRNPPRRSPSHTWSFPFWACRYMYMSLESNFCVMLLLVHQLCSSQGVCRY